MILPIPIAILMVKDFTYLETHTKYAICQVSSCDHTNDYHEEAGCVSYHNEGTGSEVKRCGTYTISQRGK